MAFKDLRDFLDTLEKNGDLIRIKAEVHWDEEMAAIAQENLLGGGPALLFENIKDHKKTDGKRVVMLLESGLKKARIALGVKEDTTVPEMVEIWRSRSKNLLKPVLVAGGPCKEVIKKGDEVDLFQFPTPKLHPLDGGRYMLTVHAFITKDPETGWVNLGTYRGMILDKNSIGVLYWLTQNWGIHGTKYKEMGKPMPVVSAIGIEPITMSCAATPIPPGICEYDVAGAIRGEPLSLVKAETVDLEVPSSAEIILEGEISFDPSTFRLEGPFGEYPGYYSSLKPELRPVFTVGCITHRSDPILTSSAPGISPGVSPELPGNVGDRPLQGVINSALTWDNLERVGIRGVTGIASYGIPGTMTVVSIKKLFYGHAKQVASALWATTKETSNKFVIVVDSDIDVTDPHKLFHAISGRTQGSKGIVIYPGTLGGALDPGTYLDVKSKIEGFSSWDRILIDATWPYEWEAREEWGGLKHPPACRASKEMIEKVREKWQEYGIQKR